MGRRRERISRQDAKGTAKSAKKISDFGEDFTSEQSLDEVILSYLAEDLSELE
jgi:hypothetical protein